MWLLGIIINIIFGIKYWSVFFIPWKCRDTLRTLHVYDVLIALLVFPCAMQGPIP